MGFRRRSNLRKTPGGYAHLVVKLAVLTVLSSAFVGAFAEAVQAGGGTSTEASERGKPRAWYTREAFARLVGPSALDIRTLTGLARAALENPHDGHVARHGIMPGVRPFPGTTRAAVSVQDTWSSPVTWQVGAQPAAFIHAALLPNGSLSLVGVDTTFTHSPTPLGAPVPPIQGGVQEPPVLEIPELIETPDWFISDTLYCTAQTFLSDGRLFAAGGTRLLAEKATGTLYKLGLDMVQVRDGSGWTARSSMLGRGVLPEPMRWYPTATRLANKDILVTGGFEFVTPFVTKNLSAEVWNPTSDAWSVITPPGALPDGLFAAQYTHVFQLPRTGPKGDVMALGDGAIAGFMDATGRWTMSTKRRPGASESVAWPGNTGTSSLLPMRALDGEWGYANGSVILAGGQHMTSTSSRVDVYDPVSDTWSMPRDLGHLRAHPASVVLPDSRILILGGEDYNGSAGLGRAQYVDPRNNFSVTPGTEEYPEVRGYHNVALLLPDGRVLFGSGNENYTRGELPSFRYYSPSYMFQPRPTIEAAPPVLGYGNYGWVTWTGSTAPAEVVLIGLGAMTHSFDMNQRHIQLPITQSGTYNGHSYTIFGTPADTRVAPPGPYMLFILDENHVPSIAKMVQVQ